MKDRKEKKIKEFKNPKRHLQIICSRLAQCKCRTLHKKNSKYSLQKKQDHNSIHMFYKIIQMKLIKIN